MPVCTMYAFPTVISQYEQYSVNILSEALMNLNDNKTNFIKLNCGDCVYKDKVISREDGFIMSHNN